MSYRNRLNMAKANGLQPIMPDEYIEYALYVRRSMEKDEAQRASIPQQLETCFRHAETTEIPLRLRPENFPPEPLTLQEIQAAYQNSPEKCAEITEKYITYYVITERKSAKVPHKRERWNALVADIERGEIRGLLGYSPDRHARNLQEGGQIINLVDRNTLRLKYSNFVFENNAAGHMMLGIWFVFAEHYSKKLSEDTTRSLKQKTLEGITAGAKKTGYTSSKAVSENAGTDVFVPDEPNFSILKNAFSRKLHDNWSDERIACEMVESGWNEDLPTPFSHKNISNRNLWSDPFFYGLWRREFKDGTVLEVDLRNLLGYHFLPIITEAEYYELQEQLVHRNRKAQEQRKSITTKRLDAVTPFPKGTIIDATTKKPLSFFLPNPKRYQARLEEMKLNNPNISLHDIVKPHQIKYSITGNTINFDVLDAYVGKQIKKIKLAPDDYQAFLYAQHEEMKQQYHEKRTKQKRVDLLLIKTAKDEEAFVSDANFGKGLTGKEREIYEKKLTQFQQKEADLLQEKSLIAQDSRDELLEQKTFSDLLLNLPQLWKKANYVQKRKLAQILILNIEVKAGKPHKIELNKEFSSILRGEFRSGGLLRSDFERIRKGLQQARVEYIRGILRFYVSHFGKILPEVEPVKMSSRQFSFYGL